MRTEAGARRAADALVADAAAEGKETEQADQAGTGEGPGTGTGTSTGFTSTQCSQRVGLHVIHFLAKECNFPAQIALDAEIASWRLFLDARTKPGDFSFAFGRFLYEKYGPRLGRKLCFELVLKMRRFVIHFFT